MRCFLLPALVFITAVSALGQVPGAAPSPSATPLTPGRPQWRFTGPTDSNSFFVVALSSIVSVSMHEYVVDGAARVTEMNVDTTGNALARFYYLEPITPQTPLGIGQSTINKLQELATEASTRTGQEEVWKKVSKTYPGSTHAHTIEFRVESKDELIKIFKSADGAFRQMRDTSYPN